MKKIFVFIIMLFLLFIPYTKIEGKEKNYNYDYYGKVLNSPNAYEYSGKITASNAGLERFPKLTDMIIHNDYVYILDETLGLFVFDLEFNLIFTFQSFESETSSNDKFGTPTAIAVTNDYVYITDQGNERIVILTHYDNGVYVNNNLFYVKSIYLPDGIPGMDKVAFKPSKIAVDHTGRIYVICRDVYEGLMEFDFEGNFKQYFGTNEIEISLIDYFWRQLISDEARDKLKLYLPVIFTSLAIDKTGFVYTTTESADVNPIQKFNYKGEDVLIQNGNVPVIGDITKEDDKATAFKSIDINQYGIYIALDTTKQRVFAYNDNGELLYIFGNGGDNKDQFVYPQCIRWFGENILILDQSLGTLFIYKPTTYGEYVNKAVYHYYNGDMTTSKDYWDKVLDLNTNYDLAYVGIGKVYYQQEQFKEACDFFLLGNNRTYYSKAYEKYRNIWLRNNFGWIFSIIIVAIVGGIIISRRRKKKRDLR